MIPTSTTGGLTTTDLLDLADWELEFYITPLMMRVREEHHLTIFDTATVANTDTYDIPGRAIGNKLKNVEIKDTSSFRVLPRIEPERIPKFSTTGSVISRSPFLERPSTKTSAEYGHSGRSFFSRVTIATTVLPVAIFTGAPPSSALPSK